MVSKKRKKKLLVTLKIVCVSKNDHSLVIWVKKKNEV